MYVKYVELFIKSLSPRHLIKLNCVDELIARNYSKNRILELACKYGNLKMTKYVVVEHGATNWYGGLVNACRRGHMKLAKYMIERGAMGWNDGLYNACRGGHMELVEYMIERGAYNWNWGLEAACRGGHMKLAKYMIKRGAMSCCNCWNKKHNFSLWAIISPTNRTT